MDGFRRARTSYDYPEDKAEGATILPEIPSAIRPDMPYDGRTSYLPLEDHIMQPGMRRRSRPTTRAGGLDIGIQTERPRLREREDDNPYTGHMDPVNQQYYYRQWRQQPPSPRRPIYRSGRLGSPWRHIKACINNGGNHLVFIDGTVKTEENFFYPPEEMMEPPDLSLFISPRIARQASRPKRSSSFNERARQGFQYWYKDTKPLDSYEKERTYLSSKRSQRN
ncbi:uncharacterized protein LOC121371262 isoform X2 [Gigantopelta aegis]|uniref:uncharacterized protein LOC121371262 isoform X2 n=1 Tax=Gigantopelta aegis TaxID=1735272 RepID=UPI001B88C4EB|nr:uncharacterized protein LOC121371262 isoform X2 [Gigantopelta aegis]